MRAILLAVGKVGTEWVNKHIDEHELLGGGRGGGGWGSGGGNSGSRLCWLERISRVIVRSVGL